MKRYEGSTPWARAESSPEVVTTEPARAADLVADLAVPLLQALVSGALLAGLAVFILGELAPSWPVNRLKVWGGLSLGIAAVAWIWLLVDTRKLLWGIERLTGLDLDRDGTAGDPSKRRLEVEVREGQTTRFVDSAWLGIDDARLVAFVGGIINGRGLSEGTWAKERAVFPKGINEYRSFRAKLETAGLIAPVNPDAPNLGYTVTPAGRAVFRRLSEYAHTHTHEAGA